MALVPRTLEARGLDATPLIQHKLRSVGTSDALAAVAILDIILAEEVGHVAIGNHWYGWLCARQGLDPVAHYAELVARHEAPRPKPPLERGRTPRRRLHRGRAALAAARLSNNLLQPKWANYLQ